MKKVYLEWVDSSAQRGWTYKPDIISRKEENLLIKSVGYVAHETKEQITITTSFSAHDSVMDPLTIPKCAIIKRKFLK